MREKGQQPAEKAECSKFVRVFFVVAGTVFLVLGIVGIFLPILPTTPFLLLATACYYKGSKRMHDWVLNNRWFGDYLRNYREGRGIPLRTKIFVIVLLWVTISYSAVFAVDVLIVQLVLFIIAVAVSVHMVRLPTLKKT